MKKYLIIIISLFLLSSCSAVNSSMDSFNDIETIELALQNDYDLESILLDENNEIETMPTPEISETPILMENPDVRNVKWGMTKEEVEAIESLKVSYSDDEKLIYNTTIDSYPTDIIYYFNSENKLHKIRYWFKQKHANQNLFYYDYDSLKDIYILKYGEPTQSNSYWNDSFYRDNTEKWGMAISKGEVSFMSKWETDTTNIDLDLWGDNYECYLSVTYEPINSKNEIDISGI